MGSHKHPRSNLLLFLFSFLYPAEEKVPAHTAVFKARIWDINQKSLYLQNDELVAGYLQGPNLALEEKIYWIYNRALDQEKHPIILSIQDGRRCLACSFPDIQPTLQLESINITDLYQGAKEDSFRFTFFLSSQDGRRRLESAAYPGWFLCTSARANEPLGLTKVPGPAQVVDFFFQPC